MFHIIIEFISRINHDDNEMIIHVKANIPYISNALCEISRFSFEIMECVRIHKMCGRVKCMIRI